MYFVLCVMYMDLINVSISSSSVCLKLRQFLCWCLKLSHFIWLLNLKHLKIFIFIYLSLIAFFSYKTESLIKKLDYNNLFYLFCKKNQLKFYLELLSELLLETEQVEKYEGSFFYTNWTESFSVKKNGRSKYFMT